MRWLQMGLYDPTNEGARILRTGPIWPVCEESLFRCKEVIRVYGLINEQANPPSLHSVGVFEVLPPDEQRQRDAFKELGIDRDLELESAGSVDAVEVLRTLRRIYPT